MIWWPFPRSGPEGMVSVILPCTVAFGWLVAGPAESEESTRWPEAEEIIERALERAQWAEEGDSRKTFTYHVARVSEDLNGEGEVKERTSKLFHAIPFRDRTYQRLIRKNGVGLSPKEEEEEQAREQEFQQRQARGEEPEPEDERFTFDRELVARYEFTLEGLEQVEERPTYLLSYRPRSKNLPIRRRVDRALNKASGRMWIDTELYEVARVEFQLQEKIRIWWGFIGSISELRGRVERTPVEPDYWFPRTLDLYMRGRILFKSIHFRQTAQWSDFQPWMGEAGAVRATE